MKKCPSTDCKVDNPDEARFCHMCGVRLHNRNFFKWFLGTAVIVIIGVLGYFTCSSCRQAQSDGNIEAEKCNKCRSQFIDDLQTEVNRFVVSFDVERYKDRIGVKNELEKIQKNRKNKYDIEYKKAQYNKKEMRHKYVYRPLCRMIFDKSFDEVYENRDVEHEMQKIIYDERVQSCIYKSFPEKPNEQQICNDLVGHKLKGVAGDSFFDDSWRLVIKRGCVEKVNTITWEDSNEKKKAMVQMIIIEGGHSLSVRADLIYALDRSRRNWELQDVITHNVSMNKTTTYEDAVDISWGFGRDGDVNVEMMNRNESPLLVGVYVWTNEGWESKKISLSSDKKETIRCGILDDIEAPILEDFFKIDFVEKL